MDRRSFIATTGAAAVAAITGISFARPAQASGGVIASGRSYLVGERGPESILPVRHEVINTQITTVFLGEENGNLKVSVEIAPSGDEMAAMVADFQSRARPGDKLTISLNGDEVGTVTA